MGVDSKFDFSGYATKVGLKCSDGRTILKDAFKHQDSQKVPLVWQHMHNDPDNVLGHAILENRGDGVYAYCKFNENPSAQRAKELVKHGDITALSIYANGLKQKGTAVIHGMIRELSLVLSGANPGALIDNLAIAHSDGDDPTVLEDEAIIYTGLGLKDESIKHSEIPLPKVIKTEEKEEDDVMKHAQYSEDATIQEVFDTLDDTQKTVVYAMIAAALEEGDVEHSSIEGEETIMKTNVFDKSTDKPGVSLTHDQMNSIMKEAKESKASLKEVFLAHATDYGIENIEVLFPEARMLRPTPDIVKREDDWVAKFLGEVHKTPFSRIKSHAADLTADQARAKGYITGNRKIEEVFPVLKRVTTPTTIFKKQKLDRDDIVDITDFDVVMWIKGEMRNMLNEEIARATLIGDGRALDDADSVNPLNIRPIWTDDELYSHKMLLENNITTLDLIDEIVRARRFYKGTGVPKLYTTEEIVIDMLLVRDVNQRRIYPTMSELTSALRVSEIVSVEVMENQTRDISGTSNKHHLMGILVNPRDYTIGADKGGEVSLFDDFDIDYNQYKYLIETRISGTLTKPKSAVVLERFIGPGQG